MPRAKGHHIMPLYFHCWLFVIHFVDEFQEQKYRPNPSLHIFIARIFAEFLVQFPPRAMENSTCYDILCITDTIITIHFKYNNNIIDSLSNLYVYCYYE